MNMDLGVWFSLSFTWGVWGGQTKTICSSLKTNRNKTITIPPQN